MPIGRSASFVDRHQMGIVAERFKQAFPLPSRPPLGTAGWAPNARLTVSGGGDPRSATRGDARFV
eukprot:gene14016-62791_t